VHYPGLKSHPDHALAKNRCVDSAECWHSIERRLPQPAALRSGAAVSPRGELGRSGVARHSSIYSSHYNMTEEELRRAGVARARSAFRLGLEDKRI